MENTYDNKVIFLLKNPSRFTLMSKGELREFLTSYFNPKRGETVFITMGTAYTVQHKLFGPNLYRVWLTEMV